MTVGIMVVLVVAVGVLLAVRDCSYHGSVGGF